MVFMEKVIKEYLAKVDSKKRISVRGATFDHYQVKEYDDGRIVLFPRVIVDPFQVSEKTLKVIDESVANFKKGIVSPPIDLSEFDGQ